MLIALLLLCLHGVAHVTCQRARPPPHIIVILADDMGWNDVSFHGSDQIPTPNIDSLGYHGVILNRHYVQSTCTPSRAALLTGKYPYHTGIHSPLNPSYRTALDISEKLLPQYLKELGYNTHIVGKWHLGFHEKKYTPLQRGFDTHFGYWTGYTSYYNHVSTLPFPLDPSYNYSFSGHDFKRGYEEAWDLDGQYATDLFSREAVRLIENHPADKPMFLYIPHDAPHASGLPGRQLEAPLEEINCFSYIADADRRTYAAMVSKLDQSVGDVVEALERKNMLENSIIVFMSDNGAPVIGVLSNQGSNYPFRGQKKSAWEGGVRTPVVVWSPLIKNRSRVSNNLMHISDWFSTLLAAAGYKSSVPAVDGVNQWESLVNNLPSPRNKVVVELDRSNNMTAVVMKGVKYIKGPTLPFLNSTFSRFLNFDFARSQGTPDYDLNKVSNSKVWRSLQRFSDAGLVNIAAQLRQQATITCNHDYKSVPDCKKSPCLFNLAADPCEQDDLASFYPQIMSLFGELVESFKNNAVDDVPLIKDPGSDPRLNNNTWNSWLEKEVGCCST